jgi:hypothetical protein
VPQAAVDHSLKPMKQLRFSSPWEFSIIAGSRFATRRRGN